MDHVELPADFKASTIWLPTIDGKPVGPSEHTVEGACSGIQPCTIQPCTIQPWTVSTAILSAENTFYFLDACNRNPGAEDRDTKLAPSTRFWAAALRFVAGLALRDRFLPSMTLEGERFHARWKPF